MASGLHIQKKRETHIVVWLISITISVAICGSGWLAYRWYTLGLLPPIIFLPASATVDPKVNESPISEQDKSNHTVGPRHPRFISIPSINVNQARVKSVGMTNRRILEMPTNIHDVGWFKESANPGLSYGVVLLVGHSNGAKSSGPFARVSELKVGDIIIIERGDGKQLRYKVTYSKQEIAKVANTDGIQRLLRPFDQDKEGLGIVSSSGRWIPRDREFSHRMLLRAVAT